jgi:hypothetical protein
MSNVRPKAKTASSKSRRPGSAAAPTLASATRGKSLRSTPKHSGAKTAAQHIDERIESLDDWRGQTLAEARRVVLDAAPEIVEQRKWVKPSNPWGVAVWSKAGIVCTGEVYKKVVKLTFARGASLADPHGLFNSSLDGNTRRAIDFHEGETINERALKALVRAAIAENLRMSDAKSKPVKKPTAKTQPAAKQAKPALKATKLKKNENGVVLLSGGNPQIPKGDGDAPVQAYIANMPGWKSGIGRRLDEIIVRTVPNVRKAVRWNSPFYGVEGQGWFASFHVLTRYVKLTFFFGASLSPVPPGVGKDKNGRWIDIYEDDVLDEAQLVSWIKQAASIPGWNP